MQFHYFKLQKRNATGLHLHEMSESWMYQVDAK